MKARTTKIAEKAQIPATQHGPPNSQERNPNKRDKSAWEQQTLQGRSIFHSPSIALPSAPNTTETWHRKLPPPCCGRRQLRPPALEVRRVSWRLQIRTPGIWCISNGALGSRTLPREMFQHTRPGRPSSRPSFSVDLLGLLGSAADQPLFREEPRQGHSILSLAVVCIRATAPRQQTSPRRARGRKCFSSTVATQRAACIS